MATKELPLAQNTVEDLFTLIYVYVDDYLQAACIRSPIRATRAELKWPPALE